MKLRKNRDAKTSPLAITAPVTKNFTEVFALTYAEKAVPDMLKAIDSIKRFNRFVLLGALLTSYLHQAHYLWSEKAGYFAYLVPLIFDAAMVSMLTVVRTAGIAKDAKRGAMVVFISAAVISATINFASPGSWGLRAIFALVVMLVIGVELVAGRIRPDFAAIQEQAAELLAAAQSITASEPATDAIPATSEQALPATVSVAPAVITAAVPEPTPEAPAHLLPTARFSVAQHEQTTGQPITVDELAARMSVPPAVAGQLLNAIRGHHPTPAPLNGHSPVLGGAR
ncbi:hypothetical protein Ahu01nite_052240 [Winogradskya humida]|uniref:DUF2637 domain-containing protein n=2 Tax=Winogradskya humida TaxID=113566 RepID=A0ABQ3ZUB1_9ACTN|nr:hypothetical protein Ahu01nite_052240 [Actinoplanes humidus]